MKEPKKDNEKAFAIHDVSSSTAIEPVSYELSESMKAHIEMMGWANENFHKYATKALMIPQEYFGSK